MPRHNTEVKLPRRSRLKSGIAVVYMAVVMLALIGLTGLAVDGGYVTYTGHQLQNAADAAALAGAARVQYSTVNAVADATSTGLANQAAKQNVVLAPSDVICGHYNRSTSTFAANTTPYNAVQVTARRTVNLFFGKMFGINSSNVSRIAIAMAGGTYDAGLIALDPTRPSLTNGNITLQVNTGGIQINSNSTSALTVKGTSAEIDATSIRMSGGMSTSGHPTLPDEVLTNTEAVPDPLAALPAPIKGAYINRGTLSVNTTGTVTADPGYYPGGIDVKKGNLVLNPGMYILGGPNGLSVKGGTVTGTGVTMYFTTGTGSAYANISLGGAMTLSAPTSGTYKDILFFVDRSMPYDAKNGISLAGNTSITLSGTIYMPSQHLDLTGTSDFYVGNQLIAATVEVSGTGKLIITYDGRNPVTINKVFLVK